MENISVRVPAGEKELFLSAVKRSGTDVAAAVRTFIHAFVVAGGYPFDTDDYYPIDEEEEAEIAMLKSKLRSGEIKGYTSHQKLRQTETA
jgi:antitoxin component of RelBE/YafQ-DinJ toxin-antitoxin module